MCLPSLEMITRPVARRTDLQAVGLEDITAGYVGDAATLAPQLRRPQRGARLARLRRRFQDIWELYLAYCEGGFAEQRICDVQLLLAKPCGQSRPGLRAELRHRRGG